MRLFYTILLFLLSSSVFAKTVQIRGFDLEVGEEWKHEETVVGTRIYVPSSKDEIEFSPFLMPEGATIEVVIKESEKHLYYKVGIFIASDTEPKFDQFSGKYTKSWLAYSKNVVMHVKYSSYNEISDSHISNVKNILSKINWAKP
ncbi:hypothetical protein FKG94_28150 [Exilibacterium tricleocarpae]|uniref:Uncharacterized protein n=1 Tax=Exilibacterium tricleocarpae TaxID=2591008 RepID=A0A545SLA0_9GAMM|nr:hypothetical protein [Exilibacterium tricleocarpae]TQV65759.1 hypothetical protein FKG94_28150 [Exilibacterium tricleocarpae]